VTDNPATPTPQNAFCLTCGYALRDLPGRTCPECGRPFDPADPRTMSLGHPLRPWQRWLLRPTGWPMIALALLGTGGLIYLSRWPRLSPEPLSVLLDEFHWPRPYTMPPTAPDVVFYIAVVLWSVFIAWTVVWQLARLVLVRRAVRRAKVWTVDTRRRHRAIAAAAIVSVLCMIFGWQQRVGQRWIARVTAPWSPHPWYRIIFDPRTDPWRRSPVELSLEQQRTALSHLIVELPKSNERFGAMKLLVDGTGRAALPSLVHAAVTERDENLLIWELRLIGLCRSPDTAPLLIAYLDDPRPAVRSAAADAVGILRNPSYSVNVPDGFYLADQLMLDTQPPIFLGGIAATERSDRSMNLNGGWAPHDLLDDPPTPLNGSVRTKLESMMLSGATTDEREAAARTLVKWPPDHYRFRVAEWGVWIDSHGHMALAKSVLDEIPPFVHRMGNPISSFGSYILFPSQVAKPIVHLTSDVPLAADIEVQIREGRPWFAYPKPDDFGIGVLRDERTSPALGRTEWPHVKTPAIPRGLRSTTQPADEFDSPPIASMTDCREGYPWLSPHHRLYPEAGMGTAPIYRLGVHWQSVIVSPARLPWMTPPAVPAEAHFRWWERLREVPSCWVVNRGEAERFLYYDGPTRSAVPIAVALEDSGRRIRFTSVRGKPAAYHIPDTVKNVFRGMEPPPRPDLPEHEGFYIEVHSGRVRAQAMEIPSDGSISLTLDPALTGEAAISARLRQMFLHYGLTGPEADGLIAAWAQQFFRAEGRRFLLRMSPAEYARQCPMQVRPTPTAVVRLGLVLTEFDQQPASAPSTP
jgi:hypothetical protein